MSTYKIYQYDEEPFIVECDQDELCNHIDCLTVGVEKMLDFDDFLGLVEDEIRCYYAETGIDRELDFNPETEDERLYERYLNGDKTVCGWVSYYSNLKEGPSNVKYFQEGGVA